jgi:TRAP-type mannitol/chloroaromatic compound transport system permease large subunit
MGDVYKGLSPCVALQIIGLLLCIWYPSIVLWQRNNCRRVAT